MQPQRGTATEHAARKTPGDRAILKPNAETLQKKDAQADRADDSLENLSFKLGEFLLTLLHDMWSTPRGIHATEQAKSSGHATEQAKSSSSVEEELSSEKVCVDAPWRKKNLPPPCKRKYPPAP